MAKDITTEAQEPRSQHPLLANYLARSESLVQLLDLVGIEVVEDETSYTFVVIAGSKNNRGRAINLLHALSSNREVAVVSASGDAFDLTVLKNEDD